MSNTMDELILKYRQSLYNETQACDDLDREIEALEAARGVRAEPFRSERAGLLEEITPMVLALGKTYKCDHGSAMFTRARVTRSWSLDDLDALKETSPDIWSVIEPYRKETVGQPSVSVKVEVR